MRRSKLPRISYPVNNANISLNAEKSDEHLNERPVTRRGQLPPICDNTLLLGPPPDKPKYGRRAARPKTGLHHSKSHSEAMPSVPVVHEFPTEVGTRQTPTPWGIERQEPYLSYKEYMSQKTPVTPANIMLPDIYDQKGQASRGHLRIRPANKDLLFLNEIEYNYEPALVPSNMTNISPEFPPINGRNMRIKSPRIRATSRATSTGSNTSLENVPPGGGQSSVTPNGSLPRLPHLDKFLQKRGISRHNYFH